MPRQDRPGGSERPSRRTVLRGAAGVGAAGFAVTTLSGLGGAAQAAEARTDDEGRLASSQAADSDAGEQLVVHVRDARTGQIDVFRGDRQTTLFDRDLAKLLDRRSRQ